MNAQVTLEENFSKMGEEFNSSNNRIMRDVVASFSSNLDDFFNSLEYFCDEYSLLDKDTLMKEFNDFKEKIDNIKQDHLANYENKYTKELVVLKQKMFNFFHNKFVSGDNFKRKMSNDIKDSLDKICDFNVMNLEESINDRSYNFKVDFEFKYIRDEYSKDDLNKIVRSFKHSLMNDVRDFIVNSIGEKQDIVSRYASSGYDIIEGFKKIKR